MDLTSRIIINNYCLIIALFLYVKDFEKEINESILLKEFVIFDDFNAKFFNLKWY